MNHVYRLTWNESLQQYVPAPETARGRHKQGGKSRRKLGAANLALAAVVLGAAGMAHALPEGGQVSAGTGSIGQSGTAMTVNQSSARLSLNWQSFNVASGETVRFVQPNASAIALNRVLGSDASAIYGNLSANGQVFLLNPNGILFGKGAQVNVGGLVASTLTLGDADFMAGKRVFSGTSNASVTNLGQVTADGGYIAFLGANVSNQGTLQANLGTVALAAGNQTTLDFAGDKLISVQVDQGALQALAENRQLIQADGGSVMLTARAADQLVSAVVNNSGVIRARTLENHAGVIRLLGDMENGRVQVGGTLDASAPQGGDGGFVETSAATVRVASDARVTTVAASGKTGNWLIDPHDFAVAASGGDITGATLSSQLGSTGVTLQSSGGAVAGAGNINVSDSVTWNANTVLTLTASNNVNVNAVITANGAGAGLAINPNTTNGAEAASGTGVFNLGSGAAINLPNVAASSTTALVIGGTPYSVINSVGVAGDATAASLQGINGNLTGHYALGSNIDATGTAAWNGRAGFTPLASVDPGFAGVLDGLGHSITGLTINAPAGLSNLGLFGTVAVDGVVRNLALTGGSIKGNSDGTSVGAIAGVNNGLLANVTSSANVVGAGTYYVGGLVGTNGGVVSNASSAGGVAGGTGSFEVGGLVGENNGSLGNVHATGAVSGSSDTGGLIGVNYGAISNAYASGNTSGTVRVGGLAGNNAGSIAYAYAKGAVSGSSVAGGLVGFNSINSTVNNTYASGAVSGTSSGGLTGSNKGAISNSYWNSDVKSLANGTNTGRLSAVSGLTTVQMRTAASFAGFGFTATPGAPGWVLVNADGNLNNAGGAVGATTPMLASEYATTVGNAHQLQLMAMAPAASYLMGNSIDASATASGKDVWGAGGFVPVGSSANPFSGVFDGASQSISGLTITTPASNRVGLFGNVFNGKIANVGLAGGSITGALYVGGMVGYNNGGTLTNVYASDTVTGSNQVGGLVGANVDGSIKTAYASGSVSGSNKVGGLVGNNTGTIDTAYASGVVTANNDVGGLVGANGGSISNSFWNSSSTLTGIGTDAATVSDATGLTSAQMQTSANFSSATLDNGNHNAGWNFQSAWIGYDGHTSPLLRSFLTPLTVTANSATKTYNGQVAATSGVTLSSTPDSRLLGTASYDGSAVTATRVGSYTITPGGLYSTQQGYVIDFVGGTLTINPAALTVTGTVAANKVYDGTTSAQLNGGSLGGVVAGDTVVLTQSGNFARKTVGNGIVVQATDAISGSSAGNYTLVQPTALTADITARQLSVTGSVAAAKVYDGGTVASVSGGVLGNVVDGDIVTLSQSGNFVTKNVGSGVAVQAFNSLGGSASGNYLLSVPSFSLSADITPKQLGVLGVANGNKIYDGSAAVSVSGGRVSGVIAGDTVNFSQSGLFLDKNVGKAKSLVFRNSLDGIDSGNYSLSSAGGVTTANIVARDLNVIDTVAINKIYDGSNVANLSGALSGLVAGDVATLMQSGTFASKNVGAKQIVTYKNSLNGSDAGNYNLLSAGGKAEAGITAKTLTVSGTVVESKVYDGNTLAKLGNGSLNGVIGGDQLKLTQSGVFVTKNAGNGIAVTATDILGGASAGNYVVVEPNGLVGTITPKLLSVTGSTVAANKVYDATTAVTLSGGKLAGVIAGDTVGLVQSGVFADKNAGNAKSVFYFNSLVPGNDAGNYTLPMTSVLTKANISQLQLVVGGITVAQSKSFDNTNVALVSGGTIDGLLHGDNATLTQSGSFASSRIGSDKLVTYTNTLAGRDSKNYSLSVKKGTTSADITAP